MAKRVNDKSAGKRAAEEHARQQGERIRVLRKEKLRLDQGQLAKLLGVSHGAVSYWERGGNITAENLRKLAEVGDVGIEWLSYGIRASVDKRDVDAEDHLSKLYVRMRFLDPQELTHYVLVINDMLDLRQNAIDAALKAQKAQKAGKK